MDEAKYFGFRQFNKFKVQVWNFIYAKKDEAFVKSVKKKGPTFIIDIGVAHAFKLAEEEMTKYHMYIKQQFETELIKFSKVRSEKKRVAGTLQMLKKKLKDYEDRVGMLDCLLQKGLIFLEPSSGNGYGGQQQPQHPPASRG